LFFPGAAFPRRMAVPARKSAPLHLRQRRNSANDRPGCPSSKCDHALAAFHSPSRQITMFFPISGAHISPIYLVLVGFVIGIMGGFFGVGGSFIAGPALRVVGLDWNFAVGTDLAHIVGKSVVAVRQHRAFGNVDLKLGFIMAIGTIAGAEIGAQLIQVFKRAGNVNLVVSMVSIVVYLSISAFMMWESRKTLLSQKGRLPQGKVKGEKSKEDHSAFGPVTRSIQRLKIWPMVALPTSGIKEISLWLILLVALVGGYFSGC